MKTILSYFLLTVDNDRKLRNENRRPTVENELRYPGFIPINIGNFEIPS